MPGYTRIAGVAIKDNHIATMDHDTVLNMALKTKEFLGKKNAKKEIEKILEAHGISKKIPVGSEETDERINVDTESKQKNTRQRKRNRSNSSESMEEGGAS